MSASVFSEENGNRPFGGFGSDVSTADFIEIKDGKMEAKRFARPLLISKELRKGFANTLSTSMGVVTPINSSVVETLTSESFGLEIEINVKHNPKMVLYYRPTKYSETKWIDMDYNKKIQAATQWELEIGKKYKVKGYEKLSTAPEELPLTLLSELKHLLHNFILKSVCLHKSDSAIANDFFESLSDYKETRYMSCLKI